MQIHTFRLKPGQDLFEENTALCRRERIQAGCVLSAVGDPFGYEQSVVYPYEES